MLCGDALDAAGLQGDNVAIHESICEVTSSDRELL
jgi:hypothetical protein